MPPVEERAELAGGWPSWSLGSAGYKPGHASRQLLVEEGMLLFSQGAEQEEGEPKPFKSLISNIDYFVGEFIENIFLFQGFGSVFIRAGSGSGSRVLIFGTKTKLQFSIYLSL